MRLTLRTLLAWLDDSLPPKDVTRIGRQLHKSKYTQDLSRRIRKVVRQRRLTVPGMGKNTPIDANVIAAYLDNNLSADQTTAVESLCLNSDVHLAEVAATHEILTILDQPVEIPPETFSKYYLLVKGPEARIPADRWTLLSQKNDAQTNLAEISLEPFADRADSLLQPLNNKDFTSRTTFYAAGILAVLLCMISAYQWLLTQYGDQRLPQPRTQVAEREADTSQAPLTDEKKTAAPVAEADPVKPAETAKTEPDQPKPAAAAATKPAHDEPGLNPLTAEPSFGPPSPEGLREQSKTGFILFSQVLAGQSEINWNEPNSWERLGPASSFTTGGIRFASPEPAAFETDMARVAFQSGTLLEYRGKSGAVLESGEFRIATKKSGTFEIRLGKNVSLKIQAPAESTILVSRSVATVSASDFVNPKSNRLETSIAVVKGNALIDFNGSMHNLNQHQVLIAEPTETSPGFHFRTLNQDALKDWPENTNADRLTAEMLARYFTGNRSLPVAVVEAESDTIKPVRDQALGIAGWLDRDDLLINALTDQANPNLNKSAINALKNLAKAGSAAAPRVFAKLVKELELEQADQTLLARLLSDPEMKADLAWKKQLVAALEHPSGLVRQLTIQHLMAIAGRDDMGYDPLDPSPKGIHAWQTWLGVNPKTKP